MIYCGEENDAQALCEKRLGAAALPSIILYPAVDYEEEGEPHFYSFEQLLNPQVAWKRDLNMFALESQDVHK